MSTEAPAPDWQSQDGSIVLYHGDCLEKIQDISDGSVELICIDPPYITTNEQWDQEETGLKCRYVQEEWMK